MVEKRDCSFCGRPIEPGSGMLFIKRDGTRYNFCASKCRRNLLELKRVPRTVKWTKHYIKGLGKAAAVQPVGKKAAPAPKPQAVAAVAGGEGGSTPAPEPAAGPSSKKKPAGAKPKE